MTGLIGKILPSSHRAKLVSDRREILDRLTAANATYHERELPEARRNLDLALEAGLWPRNKFAAPEMATVNVALLRLVDRHEQLNRTCGVELEKLEAELRVETDEVMDAFLRDMLDDLDSIRKKFGAISEPASCNPLTGKIKQRSVRKCGRFSGIKTSKTSTAAWSALQLAPGKWTQSAGSFSSRPN